MMDTKILNMLGLCRRAGKLAAGHDAAILSIVGGEAELIILACDASDRLKNEIALTAERSSTKPHIILCDMTMDTIGYGIGKRAAVLAVTDMNFAAGIKELFGEE